jgi:hypothetical protein
MRFCVAWRDEAEGRIRLLQDPQTGHAVTFDRELAYGLVAYMTRNGSVTAGLVRPPDTPTVARNNALLALALADLALFSAGGLLA